MTQALPREIKVEVVETIYRDSSFSLQRGGKSCTKRRGALSQHAMIKAILWR